MFLKTPKIIRIQYLALNGIASLLSPFTSLLFAYLVVQLTDKDIWGLFVDYFLYFFIANIFYNWGVGTYLQRSFSQDPRSINASWQMFFLTRMPLLLIVITLSVLLLPYQFVFWLLSGYLINSIQPLLVYKRSYLVIIIGELIAFSILAILLFNSTITLDSLLIAYSVYLGVKAFIFLISQSQIFTGWKWLFNPYMLMVTLPFLLMNAAGFLQSKIDLYVFAFFNTGEPVGEYQIVSGFFILAQTIPTILVIPFLKNIYRMKDQGISKMRKNLAWSGLFINTILMLLIFIILKYFFAIQLNLVSVLVGFAISFPPYLYSILVFEMFKKNKEKKVLNIILISMLLNFILAVILLSCNFGLVGGLIANACSQIVCLLLYFKYSNNDRIPQLLE